MILTPEQFNKIATKDEQEELKGEVKEIKKDVKTILGSLDEIVKSVKDMKEENTSNINAHDRIQQDVNEIRQYTGLKIKHPVME